VKIRPEFFDFPTAEISEENLKEIKNGRAIFLPEIAAENLTAVFHAGNLIAIGEVADGKFQPRKVLI